MLKAFGHPRVFILDGNFAKWKKEGRPLVHDQERSKDFDADFDYTRLSDVGHALKHVFGAKTFVAQEE